MSDGDFAASAGKARAISRLEQWERETGEVFLSRTQIARLAEDGSHYLLVSAPDETVRPDEGASARKPCWIGRATLQAIAAGVCIGASAGLSVATTFVLMSEEASTVVSLIAKALTLFA